MSLPQNALTQGGNILGNDVSVPAARNAAHQGAPTQTPITQTFYEARDPTILDDVNVGVYPGSRWINSSTKNVWECIDNAIGAAIWRFIRRTLAASGTSASVASTTSETILATVPVPGAAMGVNGTLLVTTLWTVTDSANAKTLRTRLGGIGGTAFGAVVLGSGSASYREQRQIQNGAVNAQVAFVAANGATYAGAAGTNVTGTIDTTAVQSLVITAEKASAGEVATLRSYTVELLRPDIGPT